MSELENRPQKSWIPSFFKSTIGLVMLYVVFVLAISIATQEYKKHSYGLPLQVGDDEIYYTGDATKEEAQKLGRELQTQEYFKNDGKRLSVQLKVIDGNYHISYSVAEGMWNEEKFIDIYRQMNEFALLNLDFKTPLQVHLSNSNLESKKIISVEKYKSYGTLLKLGEDEIYYIGDATKEEAQKLGRELQTQEYFKNDGKKLSVQLKVIDGNYHISYPVAEGKWNEEKFINIYRQMNEFALLNLDFKTPLQVHLSNGNLESKKIISVEKYKSYGALLKFGDDEIYYIGEATKEEAQKLAHELREADFFLDDGRELAVQLRVLNGNYHISYVLTDESWNEQEYIDAFRVLNEFVLSKVNFKLPVKVHLANNTFESKKILTIEKKDTAGTLMKIGEDELYFQDEATEADARQLGKILQDINFFEADNETYSVQLKISSGKYIISYLVQEDAWNDEETIDVFRVSNERILEKIGLKQALEVHLCDDWFSESKKVIQIDATP